MHTMHTHAAVTQCMKYSSPPICHSLKWSYIYSYDDMLIVKEKLKKCFYDCLGGAGLLCRDRPAVTSKAEASRSHA